MAIPGQEGRLYQHFCIENLKFYTIFLLDSSELAVVVVGWWLTMLMYRTLYMWRYRISCGPVPVRIDTAITITPKPLAHPHYLQSYLKSSNLFKGSPFYSLMTRAIECSLVCLSAEIHISLGINGRSETFSRKDFKVESHVPPHCSY